MSLHDLFSGATETSPDEGVIEKVRSYGTWQRESAGTFARVFTVAAFYKRLAELKERR